MTSPTSDPTSAQIHTAADLGAAIRRRRKSLGLRQIDLALQTGMSRPTLMAIEAGKETAQIGLALMLCRDLGLDMTVQSR